MIHRLDPQKFNKKDGPSEEASIPLRRGKEIILAEEQGRDLVEEVKRENVEQDQICWGGYMNEAQRAKRKNGNKQLQGVEVGGGASTNYQSPGGETLLGLIGGDISQNAQH